MIIISNYTNRIGPQFDDNIRRVHPALFEKAFSSEDYEQNEADTSFTYKKYITVAGTYYAPPREVVSTMLASEWQMDLSLSFNDVSISETEKILQYPVSQNPDDDIKTINDKIADGYVVPITFSDNDLTEENSISFDLYIGTLTDIEWDWTLKEWIVPITMSIACANNPEEGEGTSGAFGLGRKIGEPWGQQLGGVTINLFGAQYYLYDQVATGSDAFPSGSITLTPLKYLPLAVPPN